MSAILSVRGLEKTFGSLVAAHNINVAVPLLQTVGIIGANGAGKTTFVNMITGHLRPTKGSIWFEDRDITGRPSREITRLGIARSFQVPQIFASLTVLENICAAIAVARTAGGLIHQAFTPLHSSSILRRARPRSSSFASLVIAVRSPRRCRKASASSSTSPWRSRARRGLSCWMSRRAASRSKRNSI